jgi:hypothetical protein
MARTIGKLAALTVNRARRRGYYGDGGGLSFSTLCTAF